MDASGTKPILNAVASGHSFDEDDFERAFASMSSDAATIAQRAAFLMGLCVRGETISEITGAARWMRSQMLRVAAPPDAVDIVGTGGDGHATFNVSTCAAFVAAGAGLKVAKHGNRSVSSLSGASDVLSALGVNLDVEPQTISRAIEEASVGFLWAPVYHPAMKVWAPARAELGVRTIFNLLGPISNPAGVKRQVVGVFDKRWVEPIAQVLLNLGSEHAWVVHGHDGLDELSTTGVTSVAELRDGALTVFEVTPEDAGLPRTTLAALKGGIAKDNAVALRGVLSGRAGPYRDIVLMNTAAALVVGGKAANLADGVSSAAYAIDSGAALLALDRLIVVTNASF